MILQLATLGECGKQQRNLYTSRFSKYTIAEENLLQLALRQFVQLYTFHFSIL